MISWSGRRRFLMLAEKLRKADDSIQRCSELMAHVGDEFGLHLARKLGLDAGRMLSEPGLVAQHRFGEQR